MRLIHPEKQWYLTELAAHLGTKPSSLQREVEALSKAGLLEQWRDGRRAYFKADTSSPVFPDLRALLEKTAGHRESSAVRSEGRSGQLDVT
jgi:predicted transcriptional regulator